MAENKNKYTKFLFAALLGVVASFVFSHTPGVHASFLPLPDNTDLDIPTPEGDTAVQQVESIFGPFAKSFRIIIGIVAVLLIVISGFSMTIAADNEETVKTQRKGITFGIIGLLLISVAGPVAEVFDFRQGNFLESPDTFIERAQLFDSTTQIVITFMKYFLGSLGAYAFIRSGVVLIVQGNKEDVVTREKNNLMLSAAGLILVLASDLIVRKILFDVEYNDAASETVVAINQNEFMTQVVAVTNIMVSFVSPILMLAMVVGGVLYITSAGNEERTELAKKIILNSVIGIVIIYGSFALVSTVISGVF